MSEIEQEINQIRQKLSQTLIKKKVCLAVVESCTGGLLAKVLTDQAGSSEWFDCGVITYSNAAKQNIVAVNEELIKTQGAVSAAVAEAMVVGLLALSQADIAVSTTGVAGPGGGSVEKPVGLVWFAVKQAQGSVYSVNKIFSGDREQIRLKAVLFALELLLAELL